jgi:hypothetical protein
MPGLQDAEHTDGLTNRNEIPETKFFDLLSNQTADSETQARIQCGPLHSAAHFHVHDTFLAVFNFIFSLGLLFTSSAQNRAKKHCIYVCFPCQLFLAQIPWMRKLTNMTGNQSTVEHVENRKPTHDAVSCDNRPKPIYFDGSKLKHPTNTSKLSPTIAPHPFAEHGVLIDHDVRPKADTVESHPELWWSKVRHICQDAFSEFFGVFILILFGDGAVAQVVLSSEQKGEYQSISWGEFHDPSTPY